MRNETKTEVSMKNLMDSLEPESMRFKVLNCATRFKSNWLDLGELLNNVLKTEEFQDWGYDSFEDYCRIELKVKLDTAMKLVSSFGYLKQHKPSLTDSENHKPVPDYKLISKLIEAENNPDIPEPDFKTLRNAVFNQEISTPSSLTKQIRTLTGIDEEPANEHERTIERLRNSLTSLRKTLHKFDPEAKVVDALNEIDLFITRIEL